MAIDPMTAITVAQGIQGFLNERKEAQAQQAFYNANRQRAVQARDLKIQSLNERLIQEGEAIAAKKMQLSIEALKRQEAVVVTAGEAGVTGSSVDALYNDFVAQRLRGDDTLTQNANAIERQIALERRGANAEAENRINSVRQGQQPSFLAHAASTAGSATATYYGGLSETEQTAFKNKFSFG
tara:strand:- start:5836 stop:6384 length:549 start_codon:yes stop_codon:yes gene_type:complete